MNFKSEELCKEVAALLRYDYIKEMDSSVLDSLELYSTYDLASDVIKNQIEEWKEDFGQDAFLVEMDPAKAEVRVKFHDSGNIITFLILKKFILEEEEEDVRSI